MGDSILIFPTYPSIPFASTPKLAPFPIPSRPLIQPGGLESAIRNFSHTVLSKDSLKGQNVHNSIGVCPHVRGLLF